MLQFEGDSTERFADIRSLGRVLLGPGGISWHQLDPSFEWHEFPHGDGRKLRFAVRLQISAWTAAQVA